MQSTSCGCGLKSSFRSRSPLRRFWGTSVIAAQLQQAQQNQRLFIDPNTSCLPMLCPKIELISRHPLRKICCHRSSVDLLTLETGPYLRGKRFRDATFRWGIRVGRLQNFNPDTRLSADLEGRRHRQTPRAHTSPLAGFGVFLRHCCRFRRVREDPRDRRPTAAFHRLPRAFRCAAYARQQGQICKPIDTQHLVFHDPSLTSKTRCSSSSIAAKAGDLRRNFARRSKRRLGRRRARS
jgi:hypothetical protein